MAGTLSTKRGGRSPIVGINVTPMVDVVLVLLVIMMVSATYIVAQSLKVDLPKTATSDDAAPAVAKITITKEGAFLYEEERVDDAALRRALARAFARNHETSVMITADRAAAHGHVVHAIDLAKQVGITHFGINVERTD